MPDYLTPIAWQIAFRDFFPNSLLPWATYNRGDALEDAWIDYDKGIAHTFGQIKQKEEAGHSRRSSSRRCSSRTAAGS